MDSCSQIPPFEYRPKCFFLTKFSTYESQSMEWMNFRALEWVLWSFWLLMYIGPDPTTVRELVCSGNFSRDRRTPYRVWLCRSSCRREKNSCPSSEAVKGHPAVELGNCFSRVGNYKAVQMVCSLYAGQNLHLCAGHMITTFCILCRVRVCREWQCTECFWTPRTLCFIKVFILSYKA